MSVVDSKTVEAAVKWYVDLRNLPEGHEQYTQHRLWLAKSHQHAQAWQQVMKFQQLLSTPQLNSKTLLQARISRRQMVKYLTVLAMVSGSGAVWYKQKYSVAERLITAKGEALKQRLPDGTALQLNTDTEVEIYYGPNYRELRLVQGEILITTAKDSAQRAFQVITPHGRVLALGTRFIVYADDKSSRVNVLEDSVEIGQAGSARRVRLNVGQQLKWQQLNRAQPQRNLDYVDSWSYGLLVVSNWSLSRFVKELQRYHRGIIHLSDDVRLLRISGTFQLSNTALILENLVHTLDVEVNGFTRYWVRVSKKTI